MITNSLRNRRVYFPASSPLQFWISPALTLKGTVTRFCACAASWFLVWRTFFKIGFWWRNPNPLPSALRSPRKKLYQHSRVIWSILEVLNVYFASFCKLCRENSKSLRRMLVYIVVQSASLYALLFIINNNIYSVYSIYFGVGHFNFIQGYILYK